MKKILMLSDINSAHTEKWVKALLENGFKIHLFSFRSSVSNWHHHLNNLSVSTQQKKQTNSLISKLNYLKSLPQIKKITKEFEPDFVHAHYASSYGLIGSLLNHSNFYVSVWGSDIFNFPKKSLLAKAIIKYVFKKANTIFSTGNIMAQEIKKYTTKNIDIISFGIDTEKFIPNSKIKNPKIIQLGIIKSLEKTYGIDILIKALKEVIKYHNNINLRIVGIGSLEKEYKSLAKKLNISNHIDFVGKVAYNDIVNEYQKLDIFINPSRFESFGVSILEASSCGLPVIATKAGGQIELVKENTTGLLVEPENVEALSKAIIELIKNKENREKMGLNGRDFVIKNYSINSSIEKLIKHYQ